MYNFCLSPQEKATLELRHKKCRDVKECYRINAVLLRAEGWTIPMIAQALRIHESTVTRHINEFSEGKFTISSGGSTGQLTEAQTHELIVHLEDNTYHHNHEIVLYVQERYGVTYTVSGMHKWLHRNGFSYKKPKGRPYKADADLQEQFIAAYERLKEDVGQEEPILFMDAVHPTQATKLSYGWIRTGKTKHVNTTGSRTRLNIIGAIQLGNLADTIAGQYDTINAESIVDFMSKMRLQYSNKKIHLILDRSGYHCAALVAKKAEKLNIKLHFLPPYSPNLNPIERLWKVMNERVRNNRFFKGAKDFKEAINHFFDDILPNIGNTLNERINDNFQLLKT